MQRREFGNYLRENSGVKDPSTSSKNIVFVCPKRRRFVPTDKLTRLCWASHSASPLMLTKEEELRRGQREKQISQAATRRFSAAKSDSPFKESQSRPRAPTINFKPYPVPDDRRGVAVGFGFLCDSVFCVPASAQGVAAQTASKKPMTEL